MPDEVTGHRGPGDEGDPPPTRFELVLIRTLNVPVEVACRLGDLLVLWFRPRLLLAWWRLWVRAVLHTPYRWPRSFEARRVVQGANQTLEELLYGELPVATALWLLWRSGLRRGGALLDLGAGRGRPLLAARWLGASARGVELLPAHVALAAPVLAPVGVWLEEGDLRTVALGTPTHVLLNWCGLRPTTRRTVVEHLRQLPEGTRILAVGVPLEGDGFEALRTHRALFTWGVARVYVSEVRSRMAAAPPGPPPGS